MSENYMDQESPVTLERIRDLESELRKHPVDSDNYNYIKYELRNSLLRFDKEKYSKYLLCLASDIIYTEDSDWPVFTLNVNSKEQELAHDGNFVFSNKLLYTQDPFVRFIQRCDAEYDVRYRQIVVGALITDGKKVIMLKTNDNNRIAKKITLIQGHVEFSPEIYFNPEINYLRLSIKREIEEELMFEDSSIKDKILKSIPEYPTFGLLKTKTFTDLEHIGLIYQIDVNEINEDFISKIKSGEPEKHDVFCFDLSEVDRLKDELDSWAIDVLTS